MADRNKRSAITARTDQHAVIAKVTTAATAALMAAAVIWGRAAGAVTGASLWSAAGAVAALWLLGWTAISAVYGEWSLGVVPQALGALLLFCVSFFGLPGSRRGLLFDRLPTAVSVIITVLMALLAAGAVFFLAVMIKMFAASCRTAEKLPDDGNDCPGTFPGNQTVLVLGSRLENNAPTRILRGRLDRAVKLLEKYGAAECILSGGRIEEGERSEAEVMREYLVDKGIRRARLHIEDRSTTTYENIRFSKELAEKEGLSTDFAVVTDRFHQYRVQLIGAGNGVECRAVNVWTKQGAVRHWLHEVICLAERRLKGLR